MASLQKRLILPRFFETPILVLQPYVNWKAGQRRPLWDSFAIPMGDEDFRDLRKGDSLPIFLNQVIFTDDMIKWKDYQSRPQ